MKIMFEHSRIKRGRVTVEAESHKPEKFVNFLWRSGVHIKNIHKISITTIILDINLKDFNKVKEAALKTNTNIRILENKGISFFILKLKRRIALFCGIFIFAGLIYYLSGFIWKIDIKTEDNLTPYEIRQQLTAFGIVPGIRKSSFNVYELEDKMIKNNNNIMYLKTSIEGSRLLVSAYEKIPPPSTIEDNIPCNLVAKKDGQIIRVFTSAGTSIVKPNEMVRSGQLLVKGEQGKEGNVYNVHAKGEVYAKTFYDASKEVAFKGVKKVRTGNKIENYYIEIFGKRIYFKNSLNKFKTYDKIVEKSNIIKSETFYETVETKYILEPNEIIDTAAAQLYAKLTESFDKSVKVLDKKVISEVNGDNYKVRVLITAEENIALPEKLK
ncbi:sporulation protein YqfD [Candidatus Clostridium radicumherbarum]|uniref:Sporulation protein YqfD n=1 Tax=Candidatus Clostridium radicumherbarum TaxID=3381662 RepID=A0ABW8TQN5_9CLOT